MFIATLRHRYVDQKLRAAHHKLWQWARILIGLTVILFSAAWLCNTFTLRPKSVFYVLGTISLCGTFAFTILLSLVDAVAITIYPKRGRTLEILGAWLFNGFLIVLCVLMGIGLGTAVFVHE